MDVDFYDVVLDITSFEDLKNHNGWNIYFTEKGKEKYDYPYYEYEFKNKNMHEIGILGGYKVGKTYIINKLLNKKNINNIDIKTKGISVLYPKINSTNLFVILDTCDTLNNSVYNYKSTIEENFNLTNYERKNMCKNLVKDKIFRNIFIQDFIIEKSDILIVVVNQLSYNEQIFLNRLKHENCKKIIIIHNLKFFDNKNNVFKYFEDNIQSSVFFNLETMKHLDFDIYENHNKGYNYYYKEKNKNIFHLIMAREGTEAGNFFNDKTIEFIRVFLKTLINPKIFDVIKEIKQFLSFNSTKYMVNEENKDRPILNKELTLTIEEFVTILQLKLKKIIKIINKKNKIFILF